MFNKEDPIALFANDKVLLRELMLSENVDVLLCEKFKQFTH